MDCQSSHRICSFDVFDTCLTRRTAVPSGVFSIAARKVYERLGEVPTHHDIHHFVAARIEAERRCRHESDTEEVTLAEIWQLLKRLMNWPAGTDLEASELAAERESLIPIEATRLAVADLRSKGRRIVFTSDTYLPREFVEEQLVWHRFAIPGDGFYISSEVGKTKATGALFRHLLDTERCSPEAVSHIGDHPRSDVATPKKHGIRAQLMSVGALTGSESRSLQSGAGSGLEASAKIMAASRGLRLQGGYPRDGSAEIVEQFLGPFLIALASWVLGQAQRDGIRRLYFMARDCQLLWKAAEPLASSFGGIECRYLYASRQALFLPSIQGLSPDQMPWMRRGFEEHSLGRLLAKLELTYADLEGVSTRWAQDKEEYRLISADDWQEFWITLNTEPLRGRVMGRANARRQTAQKYFESEGLFDASTWAIVDLGWFLSCQRSFRRLFDIWECSQPIQGYYLGLRRSRCAPAEAGSSKALIYEAPVDLASKIEPHAIFRYVTLLEHVVGCADHPTVHHYKENELGLSRPAFIETMDPAVTRLSRSLQESVSRFVDENRSFAELCGNEEACRAILNEVTSNFAKRPSAQTAKTLQSVFVASDQNNLDRLPLVRPLTLGAALLPLMPRRGYFETLWKSKRNLVWPEGSVAASPAHVQRINQITEHLAPARLKRSFGSLLDREVR